MSMRRHAPHRRPPGCIICRCTETKPCSPPCSWHHDPTDQFPGPLCSSCYNVVTTVASWFVRSHRPSAAALIRQAKSLTEQTATTRRHKVE